MTDADETPADGQLILQKDMQDFEVHPFGGGRVAIYSCRAPDKAGVNEDALALIPFDRRQGVLAVADGAGGMKAGHHASNAALNQLRKTVQEGRRRGWPLRETILEGFDRANAAVSRLGGAATTLAVAEVGLRRLIRSYHAGDTPALVVGGGGTVKMRTVDHSPVGYAVEAGVLHEDDAIHHEYRHVISNFLGIRDMRVEVSAPLTLAVRDRVLIASDGLYYNLHLTEIVEIIRKGRLSHSARNLVSQCRRRMENREPGIPSKPDDMTFVLYRPMRRRQ